MKDEEGCVLDPATTSARALLFPVPCRKPRLDVSPRLGHFWEILESRCFSENFGEDVHARDYDSPNSREGEYFYVDYLLTRQDVSDLSYVWNLVNHLTMRYLWLNWPIECIVLILPDHENKFTRRFSFLNCDDSKMVRSSPANFCVMYTCAKPPATPVWVHRMLCVYAALCVCFGREFRMCAFLLRLCFKDSSASVP